MKFSKYIFFALVFLLPIGTSKVFFSDQSFFYGYHIFYHSFWIYLTDIVFCCLMLNWISEVSRETSFKQVFQRIYTVVAQDFLYLSILVFWLILLISIIVSRETILSLFGFARFTEFLLLFVYVRENISVSHEIRIIFWLILVISILESILGIGQYLIQGSLGLRYFGESYVEPGMQGVAEFVSQGISRWQGVSHEILVMRAYGTLPHPNLLAVLLFMGLLSGIWLIYASSRHLGWKKILLLFSLILISTGLTLTHSRAIWFVVILALVILFMISRVVKKRLFITMQNGQRVIGEPNYNPKNIALILLVFLFSSGLNWLFFGQQIKDRLVGRGVAVFAEQESFVDRQHFASVSREMITKNPIFGVGLRSFVARMDEYNQGERLLPQQHQPVHNIYLLIAAETGLLGFVAFSLILFNIVRHAIAKALAGRHGGGHVVLLVAFCGFLLLGLVDHYFISLPQTAMLFWIVGGLLSARSV